jgi:hypothetical protein
MATSKTSLQAFSLGGRTMPLKSGPGARKPRLHSQWRQTQQGPSVFFSMLKTLFGSNQDSALADFIHVSMMLHYNNSKLASEAVKA